MIYEIKFGEVWEQVRPIKFVNCWNAGGQFPQDHKHCNCELIYKHSSQTKRNYTGVAYGERIKLTPSFA